MSARVVTAAARWVRTKRRPLWSLAALLALLLALDAFGMGAAIDRHLRVLFYAQRGELASNRPVMFVRIDADTVADWGPAPWPWARYVELLAPIMAGHPKLVALVEPGHLALPPLPPPPELHPSIRDGTLVLPPQRGEWGQPALVYEPGAAISTLRLTEPSLYEAPSFLQRLATRVAAGPVPATLDVNYSTPAALPTVSARQLTRGDFHPNMFHGRVVLIGVGRDAAWNTLPTPVGPLTQGEIIAHAMAALASRKAWVAVPGWLSWALAKGLGAALLALLHRTRSSLRVVATMLLPVPLLGALGYLAFRWHYTGALAVIGVTPLAAGLIALVRERSEILLAIEQTRSQFHPAGVMLADHAVVGEAILNFLRAAQRYLAAHSGVWGELPFEKWHMVFRHTLGTELESIIEQRRDIRREPWSAAYLGLRPVLSSRAFFRDHEASKTLLVPIANNGRLLGIYVFAVPRVPSEAELRIVETMANQLGLEIGLELARGRQPAPDSHSPLIAELLTAAQQASAQRLLQADAAVAMDHLPVGLVMASLWGHIRTVNQAFATIATKGAFAARPGGDLVPICASLTGASEATALGWLRDVATFGRPLRLQASLPSPDGEGHRYQLVLARQSSQEGQRMGVLSLSAIELGVVENSAAAIAPLEASDPAAIVDRLVAQLTSSQRAQLQLGALPTGLRIVAAQAQLAKHLEQVFTAAAAIVGGMATVEVRDDDESVVVTVRADHMTLPASTMHQLLGDSTQGVGRDVAAFVHARRALAELRAEVAIHSDLREGTTFDIYLPKHLAPGRA